MGTPYVEDLADEFDFATDFKEVSENTSPSSFHFSQDVQEVATLGYVRANKLRDCFRKLLGFASADASDPWLLHRENPQWHPSWPHLRAYDVSAQELVPQPILQDPVIVEDDEGNEEELILTQPKKESPFPGGEGVFTASYKWMLVTVRYRNFIYRFKDDDSVPTDEEEWRRHCWVQTEPRVEALTVTGGQSMLKFAETGTNGPALKTPFPAPIAMLLTKKGIVVHWFDVPWEYLSEDEDIFTPTKLDAIAGKVNSDFFMERYEPGTLLAEPYRYTISTWPVAPADAADALRKVTLAMPFSFFDPDRGATSPLTRGHNLMPWGGTGAGVNPGGNGKFFLATRDGETDGDRLIPAAAFAPIFTHVSKP